MFFLECCVFDTDEGNGLYDSLDLARTLFLENRWHGVCMTQTYEEGGHNRGSGGKAAGG